MKLVDKIKNAKENDIIDIGRLADCCTSIKELEIIATEIKKKNIVIQSKIQPWISSEIFTNFLVEIIKLRNNKIE